MANEANALISFSHVFKRIESKCKSVLSSFNDRVTFCYGKVFLATLILHETIQFHITLMRLVKGTHSEKCCVNIYSIRLLKLNCVWCVWLFEKAGDIVCGCLILVR